MMAIESGNNGARGGHVANEEGAPRISTSTSTPDTGLSREGAERDGSEEEKEPGKQSLWRRIGAVLAWTPPNCRWDPDKPPQFSMRSTYISPDGG